jgi:nitrous oxidase accessory protein NosD
MCPSVHPRRELLLGLSLLAVLSLAGCGLETPFTAPFGAAPAGPAAGIADPATPAGVAALAATIASDDDDDDGDEPSRATAITGPTVITEPGRYRVTRDFTATGDAIVVRSSDVVLWLGGRRITGPGHKEGRGIVVENARNVLVHGGHLERFGIGVVLDRAQASKVRRVTVQGGDEFADPPNGVAPQIGIMLVNSRENRIARNGLKGVNLGVFVRGGGSVGNRVRWNDAVAGANGLLGICYNPAPNAGPDGPSGDEVRHNTLSRFGTGIQASAGSAKNRFVANVIRYFSSPYEDLNGSNEFLRNRTEQVQP